MDLFAWTGIDLLEVKQMKYRKLTVSLAAMGMLLLILDGKTALRGANEGVTVCLQSLIPTLFPFIFLSSILMFSVDGKGFSFLGGLEKLTGIPKGSGFFLVLSFSGGYPVGASNVAQAYRRGQLSREDGARMLSFCSNCGPSFFFGILGPMFERRWIPWLLWGIHIVSAILTGALLPSSPGSFREARENSVPSMSRILENSLKVMATVCGWVILFRILLAFLVKLCFQYVPEDISLLLTGILELANGCIGLVKTQDPGLRFLIASAITAFGGVCVTLQTASVIAGLPIRNYLAGKLIQCGISISLSLPVYTLLSNAKLPIWSWLMILAGTILVIKYWKNSSSIPSAIGV